MIQQIAEVEQNQSQMVMGGDEHVQTAENSITVENKKLHPRDPNEPGYVKPLDPGDYIYINGKKYFNPKVRTPLVQLAYDAQNDVNALQKFLKQLTPLFVKWSYIIASGNRLYTADDVLSMIYETIWKAVYVKKMTPFRNSNSEALLLWVIKADILNVSNRVKSKKQSALRSKDYTYTNVVVDSFLDGRTDDDSEYTSPIISEDNYKYDIEKKLIVEEKQNKLQNLLMKMATNLPDELGYIFKIWMSFCTSNQKFLENVLKDEHKPNYAKEVKSDDFNKFTYYTAYPMIAISKIIGVSAGTITNRKAQIIGILKENKELHQEYMDVLRYC